MCGFCCGPSGPHAVCFACRRVGRRLGLALAPVFPVRLCPLPGPLYTVLMGYKEAPVREARRRFGPMVRALVEEYVSSHAACVAAAAGGPGDVVLPVPSSARPGGSPLCGVEGLGSACAPLGDWTPRLLARAGAPIGHMRPARGAFEVPAALAPAVAGRRAVLLDDTYVSGARAQSAAGALRQAGARSVVIVALGRVLRPDRAAGHAAFLERQRCGAGAAGPRACCRCVQTVRSDGGVDGVADPGQLLGRAPQGRGGDRVAGSP